MSKLLINRISKWPNQGRNIEIYLDEVKLGTIGNEAIKEFDISNEPHKLKAKISWLGSNTIEFETTEDKNIQLTVVRMPYLIIFGFVFMSIYFILRALFNLNYPLLMIISIPGLLYYIYYVTLGRNKHLSLKETDL